MTTRRIVFWIYLSKGIAGLLMLGLMLFSHFAGAQGIGIDWSHGACYENGIWFPARSPGQCFEADKAKGAQTFPPPGINGNILWSGNVVTSMSSPKCPEGYSLVDAGRAMCAKELVEPQW